MQLVAEGWVVYELTQSTRDLGMTRFLHTIPVTLITLAAGLMADKMEKRKILVLTQTGAMFFALWLTIMGFSGNLEVSYIWIAALGMGMCHAFDIPARQSFVVEMVGKKDLMNALFINSSVFNGARIIGPALAGFIIAILGPVYCFLINTITFAATILAYLNIRTPKKSCSKSSNSRVHYGEALQYIRQHRVLYQVLAMVALSAIFTSPFVAQIPKMAKDWYLLGPKGFGGLLAYHGIGAFIAALVLTTLKDAKWKKWIFAFGATSLGLTLIVLSQVRMLEWAHFILLLNGFGMICLYSTANSIIQMRSPGMMRGRLIGIYSFCFIGLSPFGNLLMGDFASRFSLESAFVYGGAICIVASVIFAWTLPTVKPLEE